MNSRHPDPGRKEWRSPTAALGLDPLDPEDPLNPEMNSRPPMPFGTVLKLAKIAFGRSPD